MQAYTPLDLTENLYRKSSYCVTGECVEMARLPDGTIAIRDSKNLEQAPLVFTANEWRAFVQGVRAGEFDDEAVTPEVMTTQGASH